MSKMVFDPISDLKKALRSVFGEVPMRIIIATDAHLTADKGVFMWDSADKRVKLRPLTANRAYPVRILGWETNAKGIVMMNVKVDGEDGWVDLRYVHSKSKVRWGKQKVEA